MLERTILVHGYWISRGASELAEKQAVAAGRAFLGGNGDRILCPTGLAEWGQDSIGEFTKERILETYPQIEPHKVIALTDRGIVNTRRELIAALRYSQNEGVGRILDLAYPAHQPRIKWLVDRLREKPPRKLEIASFDIAYESTTDYLTEEEKEELIYSQAHQFFVRTERFRYWVAQNSILNFMAEDVLPDSLKARFEAFLARRIRSYIGFPDRP